MFSLSHTPLTYTTHLPLPPASPWRPLLQLLQGARCLPSCPEGRCRSLVGFHHSFILLNGLVSWGERGNFLSCLGTVARNSSSRELSIANTPSRVSLSHGLVAGAPTEYTTETRFGCASKQSRARITHLSPEVRKT